MGEYIQQEPASIGETQSLFTGEDLLATEMNWKICSEAVDLFVKALKLGRIRGMVAICLDNEETGNAAATLTSTELLQDFVQRDIMVAIFGAHKVAPDVEEYTDSGLAEFCNNLEIPPVLSLGKKEDAIRFEDFCRLLAESLDTDIETLPAATIRSSDEPMNHLLNDLTEELLPVNSATSAETADLVDTYIHSKRLAMEWCDRFHCSLFS